MFNFGAKPNPKIAVVPPKIRVEKAPLPKKPQPLPSKLASRPVQRLQGPPRTSSSRSSPARASSDSLGPRKRKAARQKSPAQQRIESDSDDDDVASPASFDEPSKRHRSEGLVDLNRKLRSETAFSAEDGVAFPVIHAADIAYTSRKSKQVSAVEEKNVTVELKYPSVSQRERYIRTALSWLKGFAD
jgi:H3 lysine-79-specific histone-lysine N-methyltransferase